MKRPIRHDAGSPDELPRLLRHLIGMAEGIGLEVRFEHGALVVSDPTGEILVNGNGEPFELRMQGADLKDRLAEAVSEVLESLLLYVSAAHNRDPGRTSDVSESGPAPAASDSGDPWSGWLYYDRSGRHVADKSG